MLTPVHARLVLVEFLPLVIVLAGDAVGGLDIDNRLPVPGPTGEPPTETDDLMANREAKHGDPAWPQALDRLDEGVVLRLADELLDMAVGRSPYDEWYVLTRLHGNELLKWRLTLGLRSIWYRRKPERLSALCSGAPSSAGS